MLAHKQLDLISKGRYRLPEDYNYTAFHLVFFHPGDKNSGGSLLIEGKDYTVTANYVSIPYLSSAGMKTDIVSLVYTTNKEHNVVTMLDRSRPPLIGGNQE